MIRKQALTYVLLVILAFAIVLSSCTQATDASSLTSDTSEYQTRIQETESSVEFVVESIDPNAFLIDMNEEGVPVMTGTLFPEVTLNARLYVPVDINNPGTGSVDVAQMRGFELDETDILIGEDWSIRSHETNRYYEHAVLDGVLVDHHRIEYIDENGDSVIVNNICQAIIFRRHAWLYSPNRIPWYSTEYPWQTEDFDFMSAEEAFLLYQDQMAAFGVELSSVYKVDRVPHTVFDAYYRLMLSYGQEDLPNVEWSSDDDAYYLMAAQDWKGLPISNYMGGHAYVNAQGIQYFDLRYVFEPVSEGEEVPLISLWDALETLRTHMMNPVDESEILYDLTLEPNNIVIDQIELLYIPFSRMVEDSGRVIYEVSPVWSFRLSGIERFGWESQYTVYVNAITNEYRYQTLWDDGPA